MILSYVRVSTDPQKDGTSPEEQQRKNCGFAMMKGVDKFDVTEYYDDGVSGAVALCDRPEGKRMMDDMRAGDTIVAAKLDRIFRSALDALQTVEKLKEVGVDLVLLDVGMEPVNKNGIARLFFSMLASFAEFERNRIAERTGDGRDAKKRNGGCIGTAPYGFRKVGSGKMARLEEDPYEQEIISNVRALSKDTIPGVIARKLNDAGYHCRSGHPFQIIQVQRMIHHG